VRHRPKYRVLRRSFYKKCVAILDHATDIFLHSSNPTVLLNISEPLAFFASCDHVRAQDVQVQLRTLARSLSKKLMTILMEPDDNADDDDVSPKQREKSKFKPRSKKSKGKSDAFQNEEGVMRREEREIATTVFRYISTKIAHACEVPRRRQVAR
jgi:hypothetical protein